MPGTQKCGPDLKFTSSQTNVDGDPNNSSLSVDSGFSGLNGVSVRCADGAGVIFGTRDICVIGKTMYKLQYPRQGNRLVGYLYIGKWN